MILTGELTTYHCDHRDCLAVATVPRFEITDGRRYRRIPDGWVIVRSAKGTADLCPHHRAQAKVNYFGVEDVLWTRAA